jgi:hypothetical protein
MGGGLMQLVAYGAQDIYLTGNPQITFFKVVYRRHTNFSMESIEQTFNGTADFGKKVSCTISRNGDLVSRMYLDVTLPTLEAGYGYVNYVGQALVKSVEVEIGGQRIDKHYGEWLHIWNELSVQPGHAAGYAEMVGNTKAAVSSGAGPVNLHVPLEFWFCRNPGLALPLIALQYHEVKVNIEFNPLNLLNVNVGDADLKGTPQSTQSSGSFAASLYVDYIYLDTDERRRFAQVSHEYLIEQLQFTGAESISGHGSANVKLNFNHPCKELIWVVQPDTNVASNINGHFNYSTVAQKAAQVIGGGNNRTALAGEANAGSTTGVNPVDSAKLQLNGHDRFSSRDGSYFNLVQPYQHHTNVPGTGINVYSFGLKPEEHQPSGTCNMSRIDNATLALTINSNVTGSSQVRVYATNYNVLRIMSGMGGLAYSN